MNLSIKELQLLSKGLESIGGNKEIQEKINSDMRWLEKYGGGEVEKSGFREIDDPEIP